MSSVGLTVMAGGFLLFAGIATAQVANHPDAAKKAEDLQYSVRVRGDKQMGAGKRIIIELTVVNESSREVTLDFATSGRVCGEVHDPNDKRYRQFPEATAQVVGTETFLPGKKRLFQTEIPLEDFSKEVAGRNSVAAWLCGYGVQRAWGEFPLYGRPKKEK